MTIRERSWRHSSRNRRGIALPAAVLALVVVGALIAGVFFIARVEQLSAVNTVGSAQAAQTADAGLATVVGGVSAPYRTLAVGASSTPVVAFVAGNPLDRYTVTVTKLSDDNRYIVESLGERLDGTGAVVASRRVMQLVRTVGAQLQTGPGTFIALGAVQHSHGQVEGDDYPPPMPSCPTPGPNAPSFRTNGGSINQVSPGGDSPFRITPDAALTASDFENFGQVTFDELAASADIQILNPGTFNFTNIQPRLLGAACHVADPTNWGEPDPGSFPGTAACQDYVPVIYIAGNATITGLRGQGLVLVNGDITFGGTIQFYGVVVARGTANTTTPTPNALITGSVLAKNQSSLQHQLIGGTGGPAVDKVDFQYSSCAVNRALASAGRFAPFGERSWLQLYQ